MEYPQKNTTVTIAGSNLLAQTNGNGNDSLIIDKAIVSNKLSSSSKPLDQTTEDEFVNPWIVHIDTVKHQQNTLQPEVTFHNNNLDEDYPMYMIGLLAHAKSDTSGNDTLYAVAEADDDPFIMPHKTDNDFEFTLDIPIGISNSDDVNIVTTEAGTVTNQAFKTYQNSLTNKFNNINSSFAPVNSEIADAETKTSAKSAHTSLASEVSSLSNNIGSDVSDQLSNATNELDSLGSKMKMLEGQTPAAPQLSANMDTSNGTITYKITQTSKQDAGEVYQYFIYYKNVNDKNYQETNTVNTTDTISGLDGHQKYNVYVVAENAAGISDKSNIVTTDIIDSNIYGVHWNRTSSPLLQRTDAAVGMQAGINGDQNDFDNVGPWHLIHRVTDNLGNTFVRIPKFYIYKSQDGSENEGNLNVKVSLTNHGSGWYLPKCFWSFQNQQENPYVDVGAYDATVNGNNLQSVSGQTPSANVSLDSFRQDARNTGQDYGLLDIHTVDALTCLFIVEFATLDSKSIMEGADSTSGHSSGEVANGVTDSHKGSSGTDTGNRNGVMNYRGIENLWGNLYEWIDGVNLNCGPVWICDDQTQYNSNVYANPYKQLSYNTVNGDMSSIGLDPNNPEANFATGTNGSNTTYFCDHCYLGFSGCVPYFGGCYDDSTDDVGLFCWNSVASSSTYSDFGARLIKKVSV